ncbi:MAG TPA: multiheme c-type cytochrome, partial [Vicinamibacterales bacterium]|nr:multiheme c-type cytochrome [Vicinamibacterales bacterium]
MVERAQTSNGMESAEQARAQSAGCVTCHTKTDEASMHPSGTVTLGCATCHGGDPRVSVAAGVAPDSREYLEAKKRAHPQPTVPGLWKSSANPQRAYTEWLRESEEYIRFVNPGDLRVADQTCGMCHAAEVRNVRTSMMTTGAMLWEAAIYNNGGAPYKNARYGESYAPDGTAQRLQTFPAPSAEETRTRGWLPSLNPLPRWEVSQPGNVLRVFERGGGKKGEIGNPTKNEEPGRPDVKLSDRGFGTGLRTDPVFLGLQKTRLLDPLLSFPGTNDQPGDYRGSGCTGCHVVYANDRSPEHAAQYAQFGNNGRTETADPTIDPKRLEAGHPLKHTFTRSIPSSQCMTCHMHPGTNMVTTYYGYTWWENETDGEQMYPAQQQARTEAEQFEIRSRNPEQAALKGKWGDATFLGQIGTPEFNAKLRHTQFADFHGHGWVYRAVYKRDRRGNLLDANDHVVPHDDPDRFGKAVHLKDIHLEKGMQCIDCHFGQDNHGNGRLYGETRNAVEIDCVDCHGTIDRRATLITSGPAAPDGGTALAALRTPWRERRFEWDGDRLYQRSMMDPNLKWEVVQTADTITPGRPHYSEQSRYAKTIHRDGTWGSTAAPDTLAHANSSMTCYTCHTSWTPT